MAYVLLTYIVLTYPHVSSRILTYATYAAETFGSWSMCRSHVVFSDCLGDKKAEFTSLEVCMIVKGVQSEAGVVCECMSVGGQEKVGIHLW